MFHIFNCYVTTVIFPVVELDLYPAKRYRLSSIPQNYLVGHMLSCHWNKNNR